MTPFTPHLPGLERSGARTPCAVALTVPARSGEVADIRRAVGLLGRRAGLDADRLADVALAVGEASSNAVVHAYAGREPGCLRVTAEITVDGLCVVIADEGRGMAPRDDSPGLGLGLPLMATLTTTIEFHAPAAGGTEIWMTFATEGPEARAVWAQTA